jgi:hypothetical protein
VGVGKEAEKKRRFRQDNRIDRIILKIVFRLSAVPRPVGFSV